MKPAPGVDPVHRPRLGVILKAHRRTKSLQKVIDQILGWMPNEFSDIYVVALVDPRASQEVRTILRNAPEQVVAIDLPFPVVSAEGEKFMDANNFAMPYIDAWAPDWVYMADDDRWFEPLHENELSGALDGEADVWNVRSLFFWNDYEVREDFFPHNSPLFWRWRPGLTFDLGRTLETPPELYDEAQAAGKLMDFRYRLLDTGYITPEERQRVFDAYAQAGKIDSLTLSLLDEKTQLRAFKGDLEIRLEKP
jgi:hypothetical protein